MKNTATVFRIIICVLGVELVGFLSGQLGGNSGQFYDELQLPAFAPPAWVFPVAWTLLYGLMGIALGLIWSTPGKKRGALIAFGVMLLLNFSYSPVFFGMQSLIGGLIIAAVLLLAILYEMWRFWQIRPLACWIQLPYPIWVAYAIALNAAIVALNGS